MKRFTCICIAVIMLISLVACSNVLEWPSSELGEMLPAIKDARGEVGYDSSDGVRITLEEVSREQFLNYVSECVSRGFTVDVIQKDGSYLAYNSLGYKLEIDFFNSGDMWIELDAPIPMDYFQWPSNSVAKNLPVPKSTFGKLEWADDSGCVVYVGNTSFEDYQNYVERLIDKGFILEVNDGERFYHAKDSNGYKVSLQFEGFQTMFVRVDSPSNNVSTGTFVSTDTVETDAELSTEEPVASTLTIENNQDLAALLLLKDPSHSSVGAFAEKYKNQIIEFDGCILAMHFHGDYKTRYDILIGAGDYSEESSCGPNFRLTDVNAFDMNLNTLYLEDVLSVGKSIHVIAEVESYNENTTIFELDVVSVSVR